MLTDNRDINAIEEILKHKITAKKFFILPQMNAKDANVKEKPIRRMKKDTPDSGQDVNTSM